MVTDNGVASRVAQAGSSDLGRDRAGDLPSRPGGRDSRSFYEGVRT
jgi:hypothetical protein